MKQRTRYLFIGLGFLVFALASPLIVLYVRGLSYDWKTGTISETGLLSVKTDPSSSDIFLNGEKTDTSPATLRFLQPGDYDVSIKKEGYFDWNKKLTIKPNAVAWASDELQAMYLIRKDYAPLILGSSVSDFFVGNDYLIYLSGTTLRTLATENYTEIAKTTLTQSCEKITVSSTENLLLLSCGSKNVLYNRRTLKPLTTTLLDNTNYFFGPDDNVYSLTDGTLSKTDSTTGVKQTIAERVNSFGFEGISVYVYKKSSVPTDTTAELASISIYDISQSQTLAANLTQYNNSQLFITKSKAIFLLGDGTLYRVNNNLEPLVSGVVTAGFDPYNPGLSLTTGSELYDYDFTTNSIRLVLRASETLKSPQPKADIGYILFNGDKTLRITELDTRDQVNTYTLVTSSALGKYSTDPTHRMVYFLDGSTLKSIHLR